MYKVRPKRSKNFIIKIKKTNLLSKYFTSTSKLLLCACMLMIPTLFSSCVFRMQGVKDPLQLHLKIFSRLNMIYVFKNPCKSQGAVWQLGTVGSVAIDLMFLRTWQAFSTLEKMTFSIVFRVITIDSRLIPRMTLNKKFWVLLNSVQQLNAHWNPDVKLVDAEKARDKHHCNLSYVQFIGSNSLTHTP